MGERIDLVLYADQFGENTQRIFAAYHDGHSIADLPRCEVESASLFCGGVFFKDDAAGFFV